MGIEIRKLKSVAWCFILDGANIFISAVNAQQAKSKIIKKFNIPLKDIIVKRVPELDYDVDNIETRNIKLIKIDLNKISGSAIVACPHCGKKIEELTGIYVNQQNRE